MTDLSLYVPDGPQAIDDLVERLDKDVKAAALVLTPTELRYLVDAYYAIQKQRIQLGNAAKAAQRAEEAEPSAFPAWLSRQMKLLETRLRSVMLAWATDRVEGRWLLSQVGIGPVIAAGLLAHIDPQKAVTAGAIWRFAGLDPTLKWLGQEGSRKLMGYVVDGNPVPEWEEVQGALTDDHALTPDEVAQLDAALGDGGPGQLTRDQLWLIARLTNRKLGNLLRLGADEKGRVTRASMLKLLAKRPYNADLKVLCWKLGDSFVKLHNNDKCFYGHLYAERKLLEVERNENKQFADQAALTLATKRIGDADTRAHYEAGMLPPGRIELRARRYAVKLLLAHFQQVLREAHNLPVVAPYAVAHLGHVHIMTPPNWPMDA